MPAQANAFLTRVASATAATGGRDDWDEPAGAEPAGAATVKWQGAVAAYYRERVQRLPGANGPDVQTVRTLYVDTVDARRVGLDTDDVLTVLGPAGTIRGTAQAIAYTELGDVDPELATTRIDLAVA